MSEDGKKKVKKVKKEPKAKKAKAEKTEKVKKPKKKKPEEEGDKQPPHWLEGIDIHRDPKGVFVATITYLLEHKESRVLGPERHADLFAEAFFKSTFDYGGQRGTYVILYTDPRQMADPDAHRWETINLWMPWMTLTDLEYRRRQQAKDHSVDTSLAAGLSSEDYHKLKTHDRHSEFCVLFLLIIPGERTLSYVSLQKKIPRDDYAEYGYMNRHLYVCDACVPLGDQVAMEKHLALPESKRRAVELSECPGCRVVFTCNLVDENHKKCREAHARLCLQVSDMIKEGDQKSKKILTSDTLTRQDWTPQDFLIARTGATILQGRVQMIGARRVESDEPLPEERDDDEDEDTPVIPDQAEVNRRMLREFVLIHPTLKERYIAWEVIESDPERLEAIVKAFGTLSTMKRKPPAKKKAKKPKTAPSSSVKEEESESSSTETHAD